MDERTFGDGDFTDRLGWLLLRAYADGIQVRGEWTLLDVHDEIPDLVVGIDPVSDGYGTPDGGEIDSQVITSFKSDLQSFLLQEFGAGTAITGEWQIAFVPDSFPTWQVTIRLPHVEEDDDQFLRALDRS